MKVFYFIRKRKLKTVLFLLMLLSVSVFLSTHIGAMPETKTGDRLLILHLQGVYSAKISLMPFDGLKTKPAIAEASDVKEGGTATLRIPAQYLPGEFVLRMDYRKKEGDTPYPSEKNIFINNQNVELAIDPLHVHNADYTKFSEDETENTVYAAFMKKNSEKRMPIEFIKQFLLSYDRTESKLYLQAVKEFNERRKEYNAWLKRQAKANSKLYVSNLFQFQHMPEIKWGGDLEQRPNQMLENYFEGIDFSNPLILRSREISMLMDGYMRLYGMQATTEELRDSLFTEAGRVACEEASKGHPEVYGWMVDYFYKGYETYAIDGGMLALEEHANNPNCLTTKRAEITKRLESLARLAPGTLAPDFASKDGKGKDFDFHKWKPNTQYKLLLFSISGCASCKELKKDVAEWSDKPKNKKKLGAVVVNLDKIETEAQKSKTMAYIPSEWKYIHAKGGLDGSIAKDYAILSTPAMFLINSKNNTIVSIPDNFDQLLKDLSA